MIDPAAIPARADPFLVGIGTHFPGAPGINYNPEKSAALVNAIGLNSFRDDIYWPVFDPRGDGITADIPGQMTTFLSLTTATPLLIVNRGNPAVPDTSPPISEAGRTAFAGFASRVAHTMKGRGAIYEIWNEWNRNPGSAAPDARSAANYAPLAVAAGRAIKAADPRARVIVGAAGDDPGWQWSREVVARGALAHADGFSVHLYNHCAAQQDRSATEMIDRLDMLRPLLKTANGGNAVPVYVTEWGWPTTDPQCGGVADTIAGPNIAQFSLFLAGTSWIGGGWYYELKDQAARPDDREESFGLADWNFEEKPRACFYREATALIRQADAIEFQRIARDVMIAKIRTGSELRIVAWTTASRTVTGQITIGGSIPYATRTMCGQPPQSTGRAIRFGAAPVIISIATRQPIALQIKGL